jgi:hypothetical protein
MVRRDGQLAIVESSNVVFDERKASALIAFWVNGEEAAESSDDEEEDICLREANDVEGVQRIGDADIREPEDQDGVKSNSDETAMKVVRELAMKMARELVMRVTYLF